MKKQELLKFFDTELLDKLFGFCYARTKNSYEAEELCSDIIFALVKAANTDGEIENLYPFIWRVARNVYADFSVNKREHSSRLYEGNSDELLLSISDGDGEWNNYDDESREKLLAIYRRISFLTKAYRDVMIMFYIEGRTTAEIAMLQDTSEGAIRQRLFSARQKIKREVENMEENNNKPLLLDKIDYIIWGTGRPAWGDPREGFTRMFSKHVLWLCHKNPMSAAEIAKELNVPTVYVEEELEILRKGKNGKYGLLRRLENGKYAVNFVLFDKDTIEKANALYTEQIPRIAEIVLDYIEAHKEEYLSFPYLNKKVDLNLIIWQQVSRMAWAFSGNVDRILREKYFADKEKPNREFSIYGYVDNGTRYGGSCNDTGAYNICGFSNVELHNICVTHINEHFWCGHNIATDIPIQLAIRAIEGLPIASLSENEKEYAAKAIECGYLYRDEDTLYTKILVSSIADKDRLFKTTFDLSCGYFEKEAEHIAKNLAELIKKSIPDYLHGEYEFANAIAALPIIDALVEVLIEKGVLTPPESGIGAEGCWMLVEK